MRTVRAMRGGRRYWKYKDDQDERDFQRSQKPLSEESIQISGRLRGTCCMTALLITAYAAIARDMPTALAAIAVIAGMTPPAGKLLGNSFGRSFEQVMRSFSVTLFVGALLLLLFS